MAGADEEHFLDAAILIGRVLEWDAQHATVRAYFGRSESSRHTSRHVYVGVRSTLMGIRRNFRTYMTALDERIRDFEVMRFNQRLESHLREWLTRMLREGILNKNQGGQVRGLVRFYENRLRNVALGAGSAETLAYEVDKAVAKALEALDGDCKPMPPSLIQRHDCPREVTATYPKEHARTHEVMGGHSDDALVAIEALHLQRTKVERLRVIVTTDREHFLNNKKHLDECLVPIKVEHPDDC